MGATAPSSSSSSWLASLVEPSSDAADALDPPDVDAVCEVDDVCSLKRKVHNLQKSVAHYKIAALSARDVAKCLREELLALKASLRTKSSYAYVCVHTLCLFSKSRPHRKFET